ncbi:ABC transporter permease [Rheinheimera sediminis]|uniref:ABC transporter permease n=1 Tax=Rheinheimera sp. YQF-1 TaxID=2499626 RepID=UPI000FDAFD96|nr:ABC transporter permease [Rheinheimera sp. YQF-1]RVT45574.1 ABC transporter permease [Rheinheimera sp. YQF-1]
MFSYYLKLAWLSCKRTWGMTLLMVCAIGLGIGASMTTITVNYLMSANPIPHKSEQLYFVQLDAWQPNDSFNDDGDAPTQLTYRDATYLWQAQKAKRQSIQSGMSAVIEPADKEVLPFMVQGRANSADFFPMFDVPFLYGSGWDHQADLKKERVIVINAELNERLFGGKDSTGQTVRMAGEDYKITGVIDRWNPKPKFYDISTGAFNDVEEVFVPFSLITEQKFSRSGNTNCWKPTESGFQAFLDSECIWVQLWVELPTAQDKEAYFSFMNAYAKEQHQYGRFARTDNNKLRDVMQWLEYAEVVSDDASMMMAMSLMFLLVCLLNTLGLLLAKFLGKAAEIGVRQALGASRNDLFIQHLIESGCIGLAGGLLGLILALLGLEAIKVMYGDWIRDLAQLDFTLVAMAISLAVVSALLAGLYPTWRACQVQPSVQLKSQ